MLPPVVAELRANISDYMARMTQARAAWGETSAAIGDPAPMVAAQRNLASISTHTAETAEQTRVLAETTRETYTTMRSGAASVIPGLGELSGVLGTVRNRFTEIGATAKAEMAQATAAVEATRIEVARLNIALDAEIVKTVEAAEGSRGQMLSALRAQEHRAQIDRLNVSLREEIALQAKAGKGVAGAKARAVGGGVAAAGVAVAAVVGYESVKAALGDEAAMALLRNAISKTKQSWEEYEPVLENVEGQMRKLGYADKDTAAAAQRLTSALHDPEKALNLVGLAANIARARHIDLATATGYVAKITTGHIGTLGRLGLATKDAAGNTLTTKQAIDELGKSYGGAATAYGTTLQGKWEILKAQAEHVAAQIGTKLIPILSDLLSKFMELAHWLNTNVVPTLKALAGFYKDHAKLINALALALVAAVAAFKLVTGAVALFNLVMDANPVVLVIAAVAGLAAALIYAYHHSEKFRAIVDATFSALKTGALAAARIFVNDYIAPQVNGYLLLVRGMGKMMGVVAKLPDWLGGGIASDIQGAIDDFVSTVTNGLHAIQNALNETSTDAYKTTDALAGMALISANLANAQVRYKKDLAAGAGDNVLEADLANIARLKAQAAAPPPKPKGEDPFNIGGDYSAGLKNVAEKTKAHAKKAHDGTAAAAKAAAAQELAVLQAHLKAKDAIAVAHLKSKLDTEDAGALAAADTPERRAAIKADEAAKLAILRAKLAARDAKAIAKEAGKDSLAAIKAQMAAQTAAAIAGTAKTAAAMADQVADAADATAALAAADAAQLKAALAAAQEAARQLDVANKLAAGGQQNLDLIDGQMFNRGSSFAQLAAQQTAGATINLNIAGRVTTERDLLAALHEGLLTYGRTNISTGVS